METLTGAPVQVARRLHWVTKTGAWLMVQLSTLIRTELCAQEWQYSLFLTYHIDPLDLPKLCDGCNDIFSILHSLDCKKGGLVMSYYNEIYYGFADVARKDFTPTHVRNNSLIFVGCTVQSPKAQPGGTTPSLLKKRIYRQRNRRATFLSVTSGRMGPEVFTACML